MITLDFLLGDRTIHSAHLAAVPAVGWTMTLPTGPDLYRVTAVQELVNWVGYGCHESRDIMTVRVVLEKL